MKELIEKAKLVDWYREERKEYFVVMARKGFTKGAREFAEERGFLLFTLKDLDSVEEIIFSFPTSFLSESIKTYQIDRKKALDDILEYLE